MRIFVSHRSQSTLPTVVRLSERLQERFGLNAVLVDALSQPTKSKAGAKKGRRSGKRGRNKVARQPRVERREVLEAKLAGTQAVLAVIDKEFCSTARSEQDRVRQHLELAFQQNLAVVPVLCGGAELPDACELPESLHPLLEVPTVRVGQPDQPSFELESQRVIHALTDAAEQRMRWAAKERAAASAQANAIRRSGESRRRVRLGLVAVAVLLCVGLPLLWFRDGLGLG